MKLKSLRYSQHEGRPNTWRVNGLTFDEINLLVGKNASGKTRTLNVINGLAGLLSQDSPLKYISGDYEVVFEDGHKLLTYSLKYSDQIVTSEEFAIDGKKFLERGAEGIGKIYAVKENKWIEFQTPPNRLASAARRDSIQHPYFESLFQWGNDLRFFAFGTSMGKDHLALIVKEGAPISFNPKDPNQVAGVYRRGYTKLGQPFKQNIIKDMATVGYEIEDVGLAPPLSIQVAPEIQIQGEMVALYVKERTLLPMIYQHEMSQGMFRVLSMIIHLNYAVMDSRPSCILVDDIGEGLDFDRSCQLIKLLIEKATHTSVQLIMATNDRFIMNAVPLESWSLLRREGGLQSL